MADFQQPTSQTGQPAGSFPVPGAPPQVTQPKPVLPQIPSATQPQEPIATPNIAPKPVVIPPQVASMPQQPPIQQSRPSFVSPPPRTPPGVLQQPPAPLYVRPTQNSTEPQRPESSKPQVSDPKQVGIAPGAELRTSIRTLADDLLKLKMGQRPSGFEMNKAVGPLEVKPVAPVKTPIAAQRPIAAQPPVVQRPQVLVPQQVPASVREQTAKQGPSISVIMPPLRSRDSGPGILPGSLRQTQQGPKPEQSSQLGASHQQIPAKPLSPITEFASSVLRNWGWNSRNILFVVLPVLGAAGILIYAIFFRPGADIVPIQIPTENPSASVSGAPQPSTSQQPVVIDLVAVFGATSDPVTSMRSPNMMADFYRDLLTVSVDQEQLKRLAISTETERNKPLNIFELFDWLSVSYPKDLKRYVGNSSHIELVYGQKEIFNDSGTILYNQPVQQRLAFIVEISDTIAVSSLMKQWEQTMASDLAGILVIDPKKAAAGTFMENRKTGSVIFYMNYPFADRSIDYAIVSRGEKQSFLILSNSRELTFLVLGKF